MLIKGITQTRVSIFDSPRGDKFDRTLGPGLSIEADDAVQIFGYYGNWLHLTKVGNNTVTEHWWIPDRRWQDIYVIWSEITEPETELDPEPYEPQPDSNSISLDPSKIYGYLSHDFELGNYWGTDKVGKTRWYPKKHGDPETVITYFKEDRVSLTPAWQDFAKLMFCQAVFGEARLSSFSELSAKFDSVMAPNRVITNTIGFPEGYMPLLLGGNIVSLLSSAIYRPNSKFGYSYKIETLDASKSPPDVEEVFFTKPWLWSKATIARFAYPEDNIVGLSDPWHHVIPFSQLDMWGAHVPLLNISNVGWNYVQTSRVQMWNELFVPNAYNPKQSRRFF